MQVEDRLQKMESLSAKAPLRESRRNDTTSNAFPVGRRSMVLGYLGTRSRRSKNLGWESESDKLTDKGLTDSILTASISSRLGISANPSGASSKTCPRRGHSSQVDR